MTVNSPKINWNKNKQFCLLRLGKYLDRDIWPLSQNDCNFSCSIQVGILMAEEAEAPQTR